MYGILKLLNTLARERERRERLSARTAVVDPFMSRALDNLLLALVSKFVDFLLSLVLSARARCCLWTTTEAALALVLCRWDAAR